MKRPLFLIALGFIIGIIGGLLFKKVPYFFILLFLYFLVLKKRKYSRLRKYKVIKILYIFINNNSILLILFSAIISSLYLLKTNMDYDRTNKNIEYNNVVATVISNKNEGEYKNYYYIMIKNKKFRLNTNKDLDLKYGQVIRFDGESIQSTEYKNYKSYKYTTYLKTKKIYGILEASKIHIIGYNNIRYYKINII